MVMAFSWMNTTPPRSNGVDARAKAAAAELSSRAGLLYRLGYTEADATQRLCATIAWEFDQPGSGAHQRPSALSDQAIGKIVTDTYARKPR
jgi:hypothetical protein